MNSCHRLVGGYLTFIGTYSIFRIEEFSTLMMESICPSETLVPTYQITKLYHNADNDNMNLHH
jgi:hypothetical protein